MVSLVVLIIIGQVILMILKPNMLDSVMEKISWREPNKD